MWRLILALALFSTSCVAQYIPTTYTHISTSNVFPGWTFLQDVYSGGNQGGGGFCATSSTTSCTVDTFSTTAGSIWIIGLLVQGSTTQAKISSCSPACTLIGSSAQDFVSGSGSVDAAYITGGTSGNVSVVVNFNSISSSTFIQVSFTELLPPSGFTPTFDVAGVHHDTSCTTGCLGAALTTTGTDAIVQYNNISGALNGWNAASAPYVGDIASNILALNQASGTIAAPTISQTPAGFSQWLGIAVKTTASFTAASSTSLFNIANATPIANNGTINCNQSGNHTCPAITVPSTTSGNLLFITAASASGAYLSSVSGGGTWVVPTGCQIGASANHGLSCAYVLSASSGATSVTPVMNADSVTGFIVWEIHRSSGSWALDGTPAGATRGTGTGSCSCFIAGPSQTLTGSNNVIFQGIYAPGGSNAVQLYPYPAHIAIYNSTNASDAVTLNINNGTAPNWGFGGTSSAVFSVAFK